MRKRKGIYQAYDAAENVIADERWQFTIPDDPFDLDGLWQVESEITRIAPFPDPRIESLAARLACAGAGFDWQALALYTRDNAREAGLRFEDDLARVCWRHRRHSQQREYVWKSDCEIGYNSALFRTVALWRSRLRPGESCAFDALQLDQTTFEPQMSRWICSHRGFDARDTRFGRLCLAHYEMQSAGGAGLGSQFWCDEDGVIYDDVATDGSGFRLIAVNLNLSME